MYGKMSIAAMTLAGLAGLGVSAQANTTRFFSATDCAGNTPADSSILGRFREGCFNYFLGPPEYNFWTNLCGPDAVVVLPIIGNTSDTVDFDTITVNYVNGSLTEAISCTAFVVNASGTLYASSTKSSLAASSLTTSVSGAFTWTGSSLPNAGSAIPGARIQNIVCSVPSRYPQMYDGSCFTSTFLSALTSYSVDTVQP
jgi:hypothetical protein